MIGARSDGSKTPLHDLLRRTDESVARDPERVGPDNSADDSDDGPVDWDSDEPLQDAS